MKLTGLQAPALQNDLGHAAAPRVVLPCQLHQNTRRQAPRTAVRSSSRHEPAQRDSKPRKHSLSYPISSQQQHRLSVVQTCAVADNVREALAESGSGASSTGSIDDASTKQPETQPAGTDVSNTGPQQQAAAGSSQAQAGSATFSSAPAQPALRDSKPAYRGFKHIRHNSFQKGPDSQSRIDIKRPGKGPTAIPVPREEADWLLPGRTVVGKVVYSNENGFKVEMLKDPRIGG